MKKILLTLAATAFAASVSMAQTVGTPADAGLIPRTPTIDVNTNFNNNNLETGNVVITANTNVVLGWEDDGAVDNSIDYWGTVFVTYDRNGNLVSPNSVVTTTSPGDPCPVVEGGPSITTTYRSFFRTDGSPTPSYGAWGAKPKANLFGNGFGFGGSASAVICEVPELFPIGDAGGGDFPAVQFLNNDGTRDATVGGPLAAGIASFADADVEPAGSVRMGDWERLSNGNILLVGESRQVDDRLLTGQLGGNVVVYKVLNSAGGVVKALSVVTSETGDTAAGQDMWHGAAVTANGFAIRFNQGGVKIRLFDNNGNPLGANINLAEATGHPEAGGGGRGDSVGFSGNGVDAYVHACPSTVGPWVTVINADGSIRYSRRVADDDTATGGGSDRMGAGISQDGRVVVAFQAANNDPANVNLFGLPQARLFDPCGNPIGPVFYVSERETPANAVASNGGDGRPRVAFRGETVAVMWGSMNSPSTANVILAMRIFDVGPAPVSLYPTVPCGSIGLKRVVPDTLVWFSASESKPKIGNFVVGDDVSVAGSVEATARLLGDSTFLLAASTRATNDSTKLSPTLVLIPANGGTPKLSSGFYDDAGQIYLKDSNTARQDGNPGRVGGDMRYGAVNYMTASEATLHSFTASFGSDLRWTNPFFDFMVANGLRDYQAQNFKLDPLTLAVTPFNKAFSPMFWPTKTNDVPVAGQVGRTGSSPIGLANGNFVTVGEDRSKLNNPAFEADAIATIFGPDGTIVKNAFQLDPLGGRSFNMWDSVGAWSGGWFAKPNGGITYFFDNAGNALGTLTNNDVGVVFDAGRSDGTRYTSDIRSHYMFGVGVSAGTNMVLAAWDCNTRTYITSTPVGPDALTDLNTGGRRAYDRANIACDANNRVTVAYRCKPDTIGWPNWQIAARVYQFDGTKFIPLTPEFFPFIENDRDPNAIAGFIGLEPSVAMTPREILIYAKGSWNANANPTNTVVTQPQTHCYTILSHPAPLAAPRPTMAITRSGGDAIISWAAEAGLFKVQKTTSLTSPSWTDVTSGNVATPVNAGAIGATPTYYRLIR